MRELNESEVMTVVGGDFYTPDPIVPNPQGPFGQAINDGQTALYNGFTSIYEAAAAARAWGEAQGRAAAEAARRYAEEVRRRYS